MAENDSQLPEGNNQQAGESSQEDSQQEYQQGSQPKEGAWNNIDTGERKPKVEFNMNEEVKVTFPQDFEQPKELPQKKGDGVFYIFDVFHEGQEKVITTSAWSLLRGLKENAPLAGKTFKIVKSMADGKQNYTVEPVSQ